MAGRMAGPRYPSAPALTRVPPPMPPQPTYEPEQAFIPQPAPVQSPQQAVNPFPFPELLAQAGAPSQFPFGAPMRPPMAPMAAPAMAPMPVPSMARMPAPMAAPTMAPMPAPFPSFAQPAPMASVTMPMPPPQNFFPGPQMVPQAIPAPAQSVTIPQDRPQVFNVVPTGHQQIALVPQGQPQQQMILLPQAQAPQQVVPANVAPPSQQYVLIPQGGQGGPQQVHLQQPAPQQQQQMLNLPYIPGDQHQKLVLMPQGGQGQAPQQFSIVPVGPNQVALVPQSPQRPGSFQVIGPDGTPMLAIPVANRPFDPQHDGPAPVTGGTPVPDPLAGGPLAYLGPQLKARPIELPHRVRNAQEPIIVRGKPFIADGPNGPVEMTPLHRIDPLPPHVLEAEKKMKEEKARGRGGYSEHDPEMVSSDAPLRAFKGILEAVDAQVFVEEYTEEMPWDRSYLELQARPPTITTERTVDDEGPYNKPRVLYEDDEAIYIPKYVERSVLIHPRGFPVHG